MTQPPKPTSEQELEQKLTRAETELRSIQQRKSPNIKVIEWYKGYIGAMKEAIQVSETQRQQVIDEILKPVETKYNNALQAFHTEYPPRLTAGGGLVGRVMSQREQKLRLEMAVYGELLEALKGK